MLAFSFTWELMKNAHFSDQIFSTMKADVKSLLGGILIFYAIFQINKETVNLFTH